MWAFFLGSVYGAIIANRMPRVRCAHQVCTFNQICRNGEDLWHLEVGQEWRCELDETLFAELQAHRPVLGVSCVLAWGERARLRGWSCGAGVRRARRRTMIEPSMRQQILERKRDLERLASCSSSLARTVCSTCGRAGTGSGGLGVGTAAPAGWPSSRWRGVQGGVPCSRSRRR